MFTETLATQSADSATGAALASESLMSDKIVNVFVRMRVSIERLLLSRTGCRHTAKDLLQDLYFRVLRIGRVFSTESDIQHYLIRMAINAAIDHTRGEARRAELLANSEIIFLRDSPTPEDILARSDNMEIIDEVLDGLPEKCRMIMFLGQVQGMTHTEIAHELGVSRSLVEKYSILALSQCRDRLRSSCTA